MAYARREIRKLTQDELGRLIADPSRGMRGVRKVYISQLETGVRDPSWALVKRISQVLGVTIGWLCMETDNPFPVATPEPVYFSPEADTIALLVDELPPADRKRALAVISALAASIPNSDEQEPNNQAQPELDEAVQTAFANRLILGQRAARQSARV